MRRRRSRGGRRARSVGRSHRRCRRSPLPAPQLPLNAPHAKRENKPAPRAHSLEPHGTPYARPLPSRHPAQKQGHGGPPPAHRVGPPSAASPRRAGSALPAVAGARKSRYATVQK
ncbi:DNA-directed RNA polymerases I, II, and III subunit RPABC5 isoform 1-T1 [Sarcoramphus papa]